MLHNKYVLGILCTLIFCATASAYDFKLLSEIPVKDKISAIAVNPAMQSAAVISHAGQSMSIIDTAYNAVTHEVPLAAAPLGIAVHKAWNKAVVATASGNLLLYDLKNGDLTKTLSLGTPIYAVGVDEPNNVALVGVDGGLKSIDLSSGDVISSTNLAGKAVRICMGKTFAIAVCNDENSSKLRVIDLATGAVKTETALSGGVISLALDETLGRILVTQTDKSGLMLFDMSTLQLAGEVKTGKAVEIVSVNPSTHVAVLSDTLGGNLSVIGLESKVVLETVPLFGQTGPVCFDTERNRVLVVHNQNLALLQMENPVPNISGLVPSEGGPSNNDLALSITGQMFLRDSHTWFNGWGVSTLFDTNEQLRAAIPPDRLAYPGDVAVSVANPPPGGGMSNEVKFKILTPVPLLAAITPATAVEGSPAFTIRVEGNNFLPSAMVNFGGQKLTTNYVSSIVLEAQVPAGLVNTRGSFSVSVTNPGSTNFNSNPVNLVVTSAAEAATMQAQSSAPTGLTAPGFGSLGGRILNTEMQPVVGATISSKGKSIRTDSNGNFTLENLPAGKRTILIDGATAIDAIGHYPTIPISVDIAANRHNLMPFTPYFHRQKNRNFVNINPAQDTVLTDTELPGFELRIPAGVKITGWDGKANLKVSVRTVPTDRLPIKPLPANSFVRTVYMFYFNKVGGGKPDRPIPIKAPNDLGLLPGEKAVLWYYDESPNEGEAPNDWAIAGTGTVTPDGRYIVSDPGVGIPKFCCGATAYGGSGSGSPPSGPPPCPGGCCGNSWDGGVGGGDSGGGNNAGDPVNVATGYFIHEKTDYKINGIIPFGIKRFYRSGDTTIGGFGYGTYFGYDWWLGVYGNMLLLLKPGNYQYRFYQQPDGTFVNTTDPEYQGSVFTFNSNANSYTMKKRDGWSYTFGTSRLLDQIADPNGNAITFLKQVDGNISTIILPDGTNITINYLIGSRDNITSISGPLGQVTYSYYSNGSNGQLASVQYPDGSTISYTYDTSGRMATITENGKLVVTNVYDSNNRVSSQTHPDGGMYNYSYTLSGSNVTQTTMTGPNGAQTTWRFYDDAGLYHNGYITKMTTPDGTTTNTLMSGTNLYTAITDPLGRKTSYTYDSMGRRRTMTDPLGNTTSYEYEDACSNVTAVIDPMQLITSSAYTFAPGTCRKVHTEIHDPQQQRTAIDYDSYGNPLTITDPNNNVTSLTYDPNHPGQLTAIADPLGNTTRYTYDGLGRISSATDAKGGASAYTYDSVSDRITSVTNAYGKTTRRYAYDPSHNLQTVTDTMGNTINYQYDDRNRITMMIDQLGRYETYTYYRGTQITPTTGDNLKSYTDRNGQTTTYNQYDPMGRLKLVTFNDGATINYLYDAGGRTTSITDSISGAIGYTYNDYGTCSSCSGRGLNLLSQEQTPQGTITYSYDADGRRSGMTVSGEPAVTYGYDNAGRLTAITRNIGNTPRTYNLGYDAASRRASVHIPLANGTDFLTSIYGYDTANRLTSLLLQGPTATIDSQTYTYDPVGNRLKTTRTIPMTFSASVSGTNYDAANQMLAYNGQPLSFDSNGNLQAKTNFCGTTNYTWDARNRLNGINGYNSDCTALTASFNYDGINRRISKTVNGLTTQYIYDGQNIIQEITSGVKTNYVRTLNIDEPLTRFNSTTTRHYLRDALGSTLALVDDTGAIMTIYSYDPFGNVTTSGEVSDNPFQYTGRENDGTGFLYYRARNYSPEMQRFISEDPIRLRGGINFYTYVQNNPINRIDPFGLEWRNGSYHYTNDELQGMEQKVGDVGHSMAEVAEIQDAIERGILLDIPTWLINLFKNKNNDSCDKQKPPSIFDKYYFNLK